MLRLCSLSWNKVYIHGNIFRTTDISISRFLFGRFAVFRKAWFPPLYYTGNSIAATVRQNLHVWYMTNGVQDNIRVRRGIRVSQGLAGGSYSQGQSGGLKSGWEVGLGPGCQAETGR